MNQGSQPLLADLARVAADEDAARAVDIRAGRADAACLHQGAAEAYRNVANLVTSIVAALTVERQQAIKAGGARYADGIDRALSMLEVP